MHSGDKLRAGLDTGALNGMPGGNFMGCCMGKKILKILAGIGLLGVGMSYLNYTTAPWMIVGAFLFLAGLLPLVCKCECCSGACAMPGKKKK